MGSMNLRTSDVLDLLLVYRISVHCEVFVYCTKQPPITLSTFGVHQNWSLSHRSPDGREGYRIARVQILHDKGTSASPMPLQPSNTPTQMSLGDNESKCGNHASLDVIPTLAAGDPTSVHWTGSSRSHRSYYSEPTDPW